MTARAKRARAARDGRYRARCRAVEVFAGADGATRAAGRLWYPAALAEACTMDPASPERAAGVIAALSPRMGWAQNLARARTALAGGPVIHTAGQARKARAILAGVDPLHVLTGPKETAFYRAIAGDDAAVTVDVWTARAIGWPEDMTARRYAMAAAGITNAAAIVGESPRDLQATLWAAARGAVA